MGTMGAIRYQMLYPARSIAVCDKTEGKVRTNGIGICGQLELPFQHHHGLSALHKRKVSRTSLCHSTPKLELSRAQISSWSAPLITTNRQMGRYWDIISSLPIFPQVFQTVMQVSTLLYQINTSVRITVFQDKTLIKVLRLFSISENHLD